jgi:hypothetical protein
VARASRLQRDYRRRAAASQTNAATPRRSANASGALQPGDTWRLRDAAIDFVNMTEIVSRMRKAFGE